MSSLIKQFKDKCEKEYQEYFDATKIDPDMSYKELYI